MHSLELLRGLCGLIKLSLNVLLVLLIVLTRFLNIGTRLLDVLAKVLVHYGLANTPPTLFALLLSCDIVEGCC